MNYSCCTCGECEFCFPNYESGVDFICAGGKRKGDEGLYYKNYGDIIKRQELDVLHYCEGFHQGVGYYLKSKGIID